MPISIYKAVAEVLAEGGPVLMENVAGSPYPVAALVPCKEGLVYADPFWHQFGGVPPFHAVVGAINGTWPGSVTVGGRRLRLARDGEEVLLRWMAWRESEANTKALQRLCKAKLVAWARGMDLTPLDL